MSEDNFQINTLKDFLQKLLNNLNILSNDDLFNKMVKKDHHKYTPSMQGFYYEALCKLLIISKCVNGIDYISVKNGRNTSINNLLNFQNFNEKIRINCYKIGV